MTQRVLELALLIVGAVNRIGGGLYYVALMQQLLPEAAVVELPAIRLAAGVIDVLHINKHSDFFHRILLQKAGMGTIAPSMTEVAAKGLNVMCFCCNPLHFLTGSL